MKISFLVTTHNESQELFKLLFILNDYISKNTEDEIVILDDYSDNPETLQIFSKFVNNTNVKLVSHKLELDYSDHKNFGNKHCSGDYIFAVDADEYPSESLLVNLRAILELNPNVELYQVPRVNIVHGITPELVKMFGWRISQIDRLPNIPIVNWPDLQGRIYKRSDDIKWTRKLHEHIIGANVITHFPFEYDFSLIHEKTSQRQIEQNKRYNEKWSYDDNVRRS